MANNVTVTGYVHNVKKISDKLTSFSLAVGTKVGEDKETKKPIYKNGFINCKTTKAEVTEKDRVTVQGFISFDFYKPDGAEKEKNYMYVFVTEATKEG